MREAIEFYKHKEDWSNRLVAGDSLLVMNSLLEKEGMGGKVQMVYFDPPYGIKYGKYSGGTGKKQQRGITPVSWNSTRFISRIRNFDTDLSEFGIHSTEQCRRIIGQLRRDSQIIGSLKEIINELGCPSTKNSKLTTKNFFQVEVLGFDYYNPKTGTVESGGKGDIAMWMLDHDYDGRSLFPSQVFFPMAGAKEGWATLAKNLKAEIDEEKIETFRGTQSLPFTPGKAVAVKIIDARGIESLKIIR